VTFKKIDAEDFGVWRSGPMAENFFNAVSLWAEDAKQAWLSASWDGGKIDPILHAALKERYLAYQQLLQVTAMQIEERLNDES
jgi:hypothetical protein